MFFTLFKNTHLHQLFIGNYHEFGWFLFLKYQEKLAVTLMLKASIHSMEESMPFMLQSSQILMFKSWSYNSYDVINFSSIFDLVGMF